MLEDDTGGGGVRGGDITTDERSFFVRRGGFYIRPWCIGSIWNAPLRCLGVGITTDERSIVPTRDAGRPGSEAATR